MTMKGKFRQYFTDDELLELYQGKKMSVKKIANHFETSERRITASLQNIGVEIRTTIKKVPDEQTLRKLYLEEKKSSSEIGKLFDVGASNVVKALKKYGIERRSPCGENHGMWKGGRINNKGDGYVGIWMPNHPRADNGGYVYEHTLVIEQHLGRLPNKDENVHHINGDKHDNRIENLYLCTHSEHKAAHWSLEWLLKDLIETKIVTFRDGRYCFTDEFEKAKQAGNSLFPQIVTAIASEFEKETNT